MRGHNYQRERGGKTDSGTYHRQSRFYAFAATVGYNSFIMTAFVRRPALVATCATFVCAAFGQVKNYVPVTEQMLLNPAPGDWLMYSRTYDAQRFSPLKEINRGNVSQLRMAWTRGLGPGTIETIPIVHNGTIYVIEPGGIVQALDGTNGDLIWEYKRKL